MCFRRPIWFISPRNSTSSCGFRPYGLLPRWHHTRTIKSEKPAGLESLTLTFYQDHSEHRVIAGIMQQILASHQVTLEIKEISYDQWHEGEIESDIWLNSANFTLPLDFSLFAHLCEVPLLQHCIPIDWQADAAPLAQWRNEPGELVPATGRQQSNGAAYPPLADYSGTTQYARPAHEHPRLVRFLNQRGLRRRIQSSLRLLAVMSAFFYI